MVVEFITVFVYGFYRAKDAPLFEYSNAARFNCYNQLVDTKDTLSQLEKGAETVTLAAVSIFGRELPRW